MARALWKIAASIGVLGSIVLVLPDTSSADPLSDRQVLAVFAAGTVSIADAAKSGDVAQVIALKSDLGQILTSFGVQQIARAFPDFDRADTVGVAYTGETVRLTDWSKVWLLTLPQGSDPESLVTALRRSPSTVIAEPNGTGIGFSAPRYPNDPYFTDGSQWGIWTPAQSGAIDADVNATWAWGDTTGTPLLNIGIIDGGFTGAHPDLGARVLDTSGESPATKHAYRVAGIAGAITNNGLGIAGVDWKAGLKSRIGGDKQSDATTITAINQLSPASTGNCRVINASWGLVTSTLELPRYSTLVEAAFKDHFTRNGVSICAIGNRGVGGLRDYPANYQHGVISVGAIDQSNARWSQSSTSPLLDLVAPGVDVWTTDSTGAYAQATGTSFAVPLVSGAATLLYAKRNSLSSDDVENILRYTADDIPPTNLPPTNSNDPPTPSDSLTGAGRLNIARALNFLDPPNRFEGIHHWVHYSLLTVTFVNTFGPTTVFGVPGLNNGIYDAIEEYEVTYDFNFSAAGISPFSRTPLVWGQGGGQRSTGWLNYNATNRLMTDYRHCFATNITPTGCKLHTFVYSIPVDVVREWFPANPYADSLLFSLTAVEVAPIPDPVQSFYVPQAVVGGSVVEGSSATKYFRTCPNLDGTQVLKNNARIKVVVKDASGNGIAGISAADIFVLLNGGTQAQGFIGDGADSVIANRTWNQTAQCPDLRIIPADTSTDATGTTYITFIGANGQRDSNRKWGHYDYELPVYVLGTKLFGRAKTDSVNGSYTLRIRNIDSVGGLTATPDQGETVNSLDYNYMRAHVGGTYVYWLDLDEDGAITSLDSNFLQGHFDHRCSNPNNP